MLDIDNWSTIIFLFNFSFQIFRCRILFNIRSFAIVLLINILYYIPMSHVASLVNKELDTVYIMSYMHDANVHIFFHISVIGFFFIKCKNSIFFISIILFRKRIVCGPFCEHLCQLFSCPLLIWFWYYSKLDFAGILSRIYIYCISTLLNP